MVSRTDLLMSYIGGLENFLHDPDVTEIMVVPATDALGKYLTFIERNGRMVEITEDLGLTTPKLEALARDIARNQLRREINKDYPTLSATLENGSRIAIMVPPACDGGVLVTIRNFRDVFFTVAELAVAGSISHSVLRHIANAIRNKANILISGANGTGKTTMLNALATAFIPEEHRLIVIEDDAREIRLPNHRHKAHMQAGAHASMSKLIQDALRHRIQTIIIGEVRGPEALDLLTALNTGHSGSFATIHADTAVLALNRLSTCAVSAVSSLNYQSIRMRIADSIHYVLQLEQVDGHRHVTDFIRIAGYDHACDRYITEQMC